MGSLGGTLDHITLNLKSKSSWLERHVDRLWLRGRMKMMILFLTVFIP